jgi:hypothetical protein
MHDNKVRLSPDVLEKAEHIAQEWGLKNARAAVEAVFRKYCDDYLYGRSPAPAAVSPPRAQESAGPAYRGATQAGSPPSSATAPAAPCDALDALDQLLAL